MNYWRNKLVLQGLIGIAVFSVVCLSEDVIHFHDTAQLPSLDVLYSQSDFIVDARVQTVFPSNSTGRPQLLATDSLLDVISVIKGSPSISRFVVAQHGGELERLRDIPSEYAMMQPGERYVLFLKKGPNGQMGPPVDRPGLERYNILYGGYLASFRISEQGTVKLLKNNMANDSWRSYEGGRAEVFLQKLNEIKASFAK